MAHIRDERGNPVELTDQYGNPVKLTDEHGNPVQLAGVATTAPQGVVGPGSHTAAATGVGGTTIAFGAEKGMHGGHTVADLMSKEPRTDIPVHNYSKQHHKETGELGRPGGSSSSSSEDDGEGGRRKKGVKDKLKEKLPGVGGGRQQKDEHARTTTTATGGQHHPQHEKKGIMEKIKEKLPGHHNHH